MKRMPKREGGTGMKFGRRHKVIIAVTRKVKLSK